MNALVREIRSLYGGISPALRGGRTVLSLLPKTNRGLTGWLTLGTILLAVLPVASAVLGAEFAVDLYRSSFRHAPGPSAWLLATLTLTMTAYEAVRQLHLVLAQSMGRQVDGCLREAVLAASLSPAGIRHLEDPKMREVFDSARNLAALFFSPGDAAQQVTWSIAARLQSLAALVVVACVSPLAAAAVGVLWLLGQIILVGTILGTVASSALGTLGPQAGYLRELVLGHHAAADIRVYGLAAWLRERFAAAARLRLAGAWAARAWRDAQVCPGRRALCGRAGLRHRVDRQPRPRRADRAGGGTARAGAGPDHAGHGFRRASGLRHVLRARHPAGRGPGPGGPGADRHRRAGMPRARRNDRVPRRQLPLPEL